MLKINIFTINIPKDQQSRGFSLLELVVVLTVFLVIIGVTINIFISMVSNQKRALEEQELLNQTSFAVEYMSGALGSAVEDTTGECLGVSGYVYLLTHCPNGAVQPCNGIKFINASDDTCQEFFLDESVNPVNAPLREIKNGAPAQNLLSNKLLVRYGRFIIDGDRSAHYASSSDAVEPRITFLLDVFTQSGESEKIIQNTTTNTVTGQGIGSGGGDGGGGGGDGGLTCTPGPMPQCIQGGGGVSCMTSLDCPLI